MADNSLDTLVEGLQRQLQQPPESSQSAPESGTALVVSCTMARCRHETLLWPIDPSWHTCTVNTLGAQTWDHQDGQKVSNETLTHLTATRDVQAVVVVGHTECDVLADAYERSVVSTEFESDTNAQLDSVMSVVDDAIATGVVDGSLSVRQARPRLAEYCVVRQAEFLTDQLPSDVTVAGYVHDQEGVYGSFPDKQYLVTVNGETTDLDSRLPDDESISVGSLLG